MPTESAAKASLSLVEAVAEDPFYIPATALTSRPRRILKHGDSFIVLDSHGDIGATAGGTDGLFHCDTRFLSNLELRVQGMAPLLLGSSIRDDNSVFSVDLTNPDIYENDRIVLERDTLHIVRTTFLWHATAYQRLAVKNHGDRPIAIQLAVGFGNDFADLFEVRGTRRQRRGKSRSYTVDAGEVLLEYQGLDNELRSTRVLAIFVRIECNPAEVSRSPRFFRAMVASRRALKAATRHSATVQTSNDVFNEVLCRAMADLYMLITDTPQGPYPYAGIPWYSTTFGRDGLITALEMLWLDPAIARGVLRRLAAHQAKFDDPENDAQPGKILHEMRGGEMAALREVPFGLYYGSVDSTPLFVLLAGLYAERTGDLATLRELWPSIEAALAWIDGPGDPDRDGFVEYYRATEQGLANQGWKDSYDAVFHANGRLAEGPIALAEVQGYVYAAKHLAAECARRLGNLDKAAALEAQAVRLRETFEAAFWRPKLETYALALDGAKKPCDVRSSNAGQLLFTGIVRPERAIQVAEGLLRPQFFSGWGIRTVSSKERRFNPMSYHNGSIWPHDNALIALGFGRYELKSAVAQVFTAMFEAAAYMDLRRLPELFCGFQRRRGRGPTLYPVACSPQAWACGAPFLMLQASLGLEFDVARNEIRLRSPCLPPFLEEVAVSNLRLGDSSVDLTVHREPDGKVSLRVGRKSGNVQIGLV
ncbi:MAG: amylo-alpha-1,6-glucosidase [Alphaproteobacteria bacterium]|nr:MAG: amylo-alpha-1,6-glucosidase [Alphaproteobacteria bacterium]